SQPIGTRIRSDNYLLPGMILSDGLLVFLYYNKNFLKMKMEAGYYFDYEFVIPIENFVWIL
ncbi:unnamed protein product, partial [Rotaria sordida]